MMIFILSTNQMQTVYEGSLQIRSLEQNITVNIDFMLQYKFKESMGRPSNSDIYIAGLGALSTSWVRVRDISPVPSLLPGQGRGLQLTRVLPGDGGHQQPASQHRAPGPQN